MVATCLKQCLGEEWNWTMWWRCGHALITKFPHPSHASCPLICLSFHTTQLFVHQFLDHFANALFQRGTGWGSWLSCYRWIRRLLGLWLFLRHRLSICTHLWQGVSFARHFMWMQATKAGRLLKWALKGLGIQFCALKTGGMPSHSGKSPSAIFWKFKNRFFWKCFSRSVDFFTVACGLIGYRRTAVSNLHCAWAAGNKARFFQQGFGPIFGNLLSVLCLRLSVLWIFLFGSVLAGTGA